MVAFSQSTAENRNDVNSAFNFQLSAFEYGSFPNFTFCFIWKLDVERSMLNVGRSFSRNPFVEEQLSNVEM